MSSYACLWDIDTCSLQEEQPSAEKTSKKGGEQAGPSIGVVSTGMPTEKQEE